MGVTQGGAAVAAAANEPCSRVLEGGHQRETFVASSLGNWKWSRQPDAGGRVAKTEHGLLGNWVSKPAGKG